jgi:hypothetical protein
LSPVLTSLFDVLVFGGLSIRMTIVAALYRKPHLLCLAFPVPN